MNTFKIILTVLMTIAGIILVLCSVNLIKTIKTNGDKKVEDIENKLNMNLSVIAFLTITVAALLIINMMIR